MDLVHCAASGTIQWPAGGSVNLCVQLCRRCGAHDGGEQQRMLEHEAKRELRHTTLQVSVRCDACVCPHGLSVQREGQVGIETRSEALSEAVDRRIGNQRTHLADIDAFRMVSLHILIAACLRVALQPRVLRRC